MAARRDTGGPVVRLGTSEVIAFRLHAHHLTERRPADELHAAAGACGVQNSPPGSALLALGARIEDVTRDRIDHLVGERKSLVQTWCMRGSPFYFPTAEAPVFTTGVLPATEQARLHLIIGVEQALRALGMGLDEAVERTAAEIRTVLSGRQLAVNELGAALAERIAGGLSSARRDAWRAPGPHGANQPLGEAVVHFCLRMLTLRGIVCLAPRSGGKAPFVLVEEWLGQDKQFHRRVWKAVGEPGTVLADGRIVGTWRPNKNGQHLTLRIEPFRSRSAKLGDQLRAEAEHVAELRGASSLQVEEDDAAR